MKKKLIITLLSTSLLLNACTGFTREYPEMDQDKNIVQTSTSLEQSLEFNRAIYEIKNDGPKICQKIGEMLFKSAEYKAINDSKFSCTYYDYKPITYLLTPVAYIAVSFNFSLSPGTNQQTKVTLSKISRYVNSQGDIVKEEIARTKEDQLLLRRILRNIDNI